jgi:hypothetical protein
VNYIEVNNIFYRIKESKQKKKGRERENERRVSGALQRKNQSAANIPFSSFLKKRVETSQVEK